MYLYLLGDPVLKTATRYHLDDHPMTLIPVQTLPYILVRYMMTQPTKPNAMVNNDLYFLRRIPKGQSAHR